MSRRFCAVLNRITAGAIFDLYLNYFWIYIVRNFVLIYLSSVFFPHQTLTSECTPIIKCHGESYTQLLYLHGFRFRFSEWSGEPKTNRPGLFATACHTYFNDNLSTFFLFITNVYPGRQPRIRRRRRRPKVVYYTSALYRCYYTIAKVMGAKRFRTNVFRVLLFPSVRTVTYVDFAR